MSVIGLIGAAFVVIAAGFAVLGYLLDGPDVRRYVWRVLALFSVAFAFGFWAHDDHGWWRVGDYVFLFLNCSWAMGAWRRLESLRKQRAHLSKSTHP